MKTAFFQWSRCCLSTPGTGLNHPFNGSSNSCGICQACLPADGSSVEALKELCDTLHPEDAHRLAQSQLRECQSRLADIQRQFSGDQDAPLPDSR